MKQPGFTARAPGTRAIRRGAQPMRLETLAAEFALLAQRRARLRHQLDLLDRQHQAASRTYLMLEARMAVLARRMGVKDGGVTDGGVKDVGVREAAVVAPAPQPPAAIPLPPARPAASTASPPVPPQAPAIQPTRAAGRPVRRRRELVLEY